MEIRALINYVEQAPIGILLFAVLSGAIWLIGLVIVLWGTGPSDRAQIIQAYGIAFPWRRARPTPTRSQSGTERHHPEGLAE